MKGCARSTAPSFQVWGRPSVLGCAEAPRWLADGKTEVVLIACGFRLGRGVRTLREIKSSWPSTVVVLLAEKTLDDTVIEAFHAAARYFFKKPVDAGKVRNLILNDLTHNIVPALE